MKRVLVTFCACVIVAMLTGCEIKGSISDTSSENKMTENSQTEVVSETQASQESQTSSEDGGQAPRETEMQAPSETETQVPSESETQIPNGSETPEICEHEWIGATCENPDTCINCGKTEGLALGHHASNVRCLEEMFCDKCGKSMGISEHEFLKEECIWCGAIDTKVGWKLEGTTLIIYGNGPMPNYDGNGGPWEAKDVKKIIIEEGVTSIGDYAFFGHSNLTSIEIADSVTRIGEHAFNSCDSLTSIDIPDSVTYIGDLAFNATGLTSVEIPDSVTSMGKCVFRMCQKLVSIKAPKNLINANANQAFSNCSSLVSIELSTNTTQIGDWAFSDCESLEQIVIPNSVVSIGYSAFYDCDSLTSVEIPNGVTSIGANAFHDCDGLRSIVIPSSVTNIGETIFKSCYISKLIVYGEAGSTIEAYCKENGYTFYAQPSKIVETSKECEEYKVSKQSYDYAEQISEKYYLVQYDTERNGDTYHIVDFKDNVIASYDSEPPVKVGKNQIAFKKDREMIIFDTNEGKELLRLCTEEFSSTKVNYITCEIDGHIYSLVSFNESAYWKDNLSAELYVTRRDYYNGIICESVFVTLEDDWNNSEKVITNQQRCRFINAYTGEEIYVGYSNQYIYELPDGFSAYMFSCDTNESEVVFLEEDIFTGKRYLTAVGLNEVSKNESDYDLVNYLHKRNNRYSDGWLIHAENGIMINVKTMEVVDLPSDKSILLEGGYGTFFVAMTATRDDEGYKYDIYNGDKVIKEDCTELSINNGFVVYTRDNVRYTYMNNQGKDLLTVKYYTDFIDGRALVYDGKGVFYVDETLARISDYIYEGCIDCLYSGAIRINNQFYLVSPK